MTFFRRNRLFILGLIAGVFFNTLITYLYMLYQILELEGSLENFIVLLNYNNSPLTYMITLSLLLSTVVFTIIQNKQPFRFVMGFVLSSLVIVGFMLILKFFYF